MDDDFPSGRLLWADAVLLLPTLNEEKGLARTLSELPREQFFGRGRRIQPLVYDGGSTDGTLEVAREWGIPVGRQKTRGKGRAVLEAIQRIHSLGIPYVIVQDADATYSPAQILPALDLLRSGTDLVIGVRRPVWGAPRDFKDLSHRFGNLLLSYASSLVSRRAILDICSGFWAISTDRFMSLAVDSASFAIEAEIVLKAIRGGMTVYQIPVDFRERVGEAKLRAVHDGSQILLAILRNARPNRHGPVPAGGIGLSRTRELLSIAVAAEARSALVECGPSEAPAADHLARSLQPTLPATRVRVDATARLDSPSDLGSRDEPRQVSDPFVVSLPSGGAHAGEAVSTTISIRSARRQLTIELPNDDPSAGAASRHPVSMMARAGGRLLSSFVPDGSRSPSLAVLTTRMNFDPVLRQRLLLSANGFRVVESSRNPRSPRDASLDRISRGGAATVPP